MERDRAAFMATVTDLLPEFRREQQRLFTRLGDVRFTSYNLRALWSTWGDLATDGDRALHPGSEAVTIPVTVERYRIRGLDRAPAAEDLFYTFAKFDGSWSISGDRGAEDLGFSTTRHLWDVGPVKVERHGAFSIFRHPCRDKKCAQLPAGVDGILNAALARAQQHWSGPWPRRIGVVVPDTKAELRTVLQASFDVTDFIAFAYSTLDNEEYSAPRIVLNWRALQGRSTESIVRVFAHELVHVATRSSAGPFVPIFVDEGFADHAANAGSSAGLAFFDYQRSAGAVDATLPQDYEFTTGSGSSIFLNYQTAQSAVDFFVRTWGQPAFERFYKRLGATRAVAGTTEFHVSAAMRQTIGVGLARFERAWADSLGL